MAHIDIFRDDAFGLVEMTAAVSKMPRLPTMLGDLNLFTPKPIRTTVASFEQNAGRLTLIPTTPRGAPLPTATRDARTLRHLETVRIAKSDSLQAAELQNLRAFGTDSELAVVQTEVAKRLAGLRIDTELTWENMRLGAIQGIVYDADGTTVLYNLYDLFDVSQPTEIDFDLDNASPAEGVLRKTCAGVVRATRNALQNGWIKGRTRVGAAVDDVFWDQLIAHKEVRDTFKNWNAAVELRGEADTGAFRFGGIDWMHYDGTDGSAESSSVKAPTGKAKFFPIDTAPDVWQVALGPGEFLDNVNQPGQPIYALTLPDPSGRNAFVGIETYSYPLFVCTRPQALQRGKNT